MTSPPSAPTPDPTDNWAGEADTVNPLPARIRRAVREFADQVAARQNAGVADLYADVPSFDQMVGSL